MKTLIIHPKDQSTDFLSCIYNDIDCTVINTDISHNNLKQQIKDHDRIIMLGHGCKDGLYGYNRLLIDSKLVYLLRDKECVCIWCNADIFVKKYELQGFYTGMIISEYEEAMDYMLIDNFTSKDINDSNKYFANTIKLYINEQGMRDKIVEEYSKLDNYIVDFNKYNIYITNNSKFN